MQIEFKLERGCATKTVNATVATIQPERSMIGPSVIVRGTVFDIPLNILIDTGASASLISTRTTEQLNLLDRITPATRVIKGLGNNEVRTRGEVTFPITVAKTEVTHTFIVMDDLPDDVLAGTELLEKLSLTIDMPRKQIRTKYGKTSFYDTPRTLTSSCKVKVCKTACLPANSVMHIKCRLVRPSNSGTLEGMLIGNRKMPGSLGICVENSLVHSDKNLVAVRCVNPLPCEVTLHKNRIVANMFPVDQSYRDRSKEKLHGKYDSSIDIPRLPDAINQK